MVPSRTAQAPPPPIIRTPVPTNHDWRLRQDITRKGDTMIMVLDRFVREALAREEEKRKERAQVKDTE